MPIFFNRIKKLPFFENHSAKIEIYYIRKIRTTQVNFCMAYKKDIYISLVCATSLMILRTPLVIAFEEIVAPVIASISPPILI